MTSLKVRSKIILALWITAILLLNPKVSAEPAEVGRQWPTLTEVMTKWANVPLENIELAANQNDLTAAHYLGYCYTTGFRFSLNATKGIEWYEKAGGAGYLPSYSNLGGLYGDGQVVQKDPDKMLHFYRLAADGGFAVAQAQLAMRYRCGCGISPDLAEAQKWRDKVETSGNGRALYEIARDFETPAKPATIQSCDQDRREIIRWLTLAVTVNHVEASYNLGLRYLEGRDVETDEQGGLELIRKGADLGYFKSIVELAELYLKGVGEPRNPNDQPVALLLKAVQLSPHEGAGYSALIYYYEFQAGQKRDLIAASQWYYQAAVAGAGTYSFSPQANIEATVLSSFYSVAQDSLQPFNLSMLNARSPLASIFTLYTKAAAPDDSAALSSLGNMYLTGKNVPMDAVRAAAFLELAAKRGDTAARQKITTIEADLKPADLTEVRTQLANLEQEFQAIADSASISRSSPWSRKPSN